MLEVDSPEYLAEVKVFAASIGKAEALQEQLDWLDTYGNHGLVRGDPGWTEHRCVLYKDFAPHSFEFRMFQSDGHGGWTFWFNGGLLFYGGAESGAGAPQYSVTLSGRSDARWEVHT